MTERHAPFVFLAVVAFCGAGGAWAASGEPAPSSGSAGAGPARSVIGPVSRPPAGGDPKTAKPKAAEGAEVEADAGAAAHAANAKPDADPRGAFTDADDAHREALATAPIAAIEKGSGGRSLAFRITLADGTVGYYKPQQTFSGTNWYAEVAAYYLDRELGLRRVPPTVGRRLDWRPLRRVAGDDERVDEIIVQDDGTVRGAFVWWIPEDIPPIEPGAYWERWIRVQGAVDVSPLVAAYEWRRALWKGWAAHSGELEEPDTPDRPAELSDLVLFDYLIHNIDRWGTDFTNVRTRGPEGPLIFLDNAAGFFPGRHRTGLMDARLSIVQKFRRRTVEAIRSLDVERFEERLSTDPLAPVLEAHFLEGLEVRRRHVLAHVAEMERRFGDRVYSW